MSLTRLAVLAAIVFASVPNACAQDNAEESPLAIFAQQPIPSPFLVRCCHTASWEKVHPFFSSAGAEVLE